MGLGCGFQSVLVNYINEYGVLTMKNCKVKHSDQPGIVVSDAQMADDNEFYVVVLFESGEFVKCAASDLQLIREIEG